MFEHGLFYVYKHQFIFMSTNRLNTTTTSWSHHTQANKIIQDHSGYFKREQMQDSPRIDNHLVFRVNFFLVPCGPIFKVNSNQLDLVLQTLHN